jgi:type IV secretory pathway ATPase VirB11/archaellum biosynthesis ATPase
MCAIEAWQRRVPFGGSPRCEPDTNCGLLRATLWRRPDRIIVGEVCGAEEFDLLRALNT